MIITAHRGIRDTAPENTIAAFQRAIGLGADAVEMDVRLTSDRVPIVYHYYYLDKLTSASGAVFNHTLDQIRKIQFRKDSNNGAEGAVIPTLCEVLEAIGGKIGLEIEIKGPEPEAPYLTADVLSGFKPAWGRMEITSFEPALLLSIQERCPGLTTDLLFPLSEEWMRPDVVAYQALHRARLARARAVHLHSTQLTRGAVSTIRKQGIDVHAWNVNDEQAAAAALDLEISNICTDNFQTISEYVRGAPPAGG